MSTSEGEVLGMFKSGTRSRTAKTSVGILVTAVAVVLAACAEDATDAAPDEVAVPDEMAIADQPGMAYAPLVIIKEGGWLEEELPDTQITWERIDSPPAVREAMISDDVQVGAGSANGSFLVGWGAGVEWGLLSGMSEMDIWLMADEEGDINGLEDFGSGDQIAVPSPDSLQANLLRFAAEEELGAADALDDNMVAIGHPDAVRALLGGQIAAHFSSPPFQFEQEEQGAERILGAVDILGPHTFTAVFLRNDFAEEYPEAVQLLDEQLARAIELIEDDPEAAAQLLSDDVGGDPPPETFASYIGAEGVTYTQELTGMLHFGEFLHEIGQIDRVPESTEELMLDLP